MPLSARLLRKFGSPDRIFHASLTELEARSLPALVARPLSRKMRLSAPRKNWQRFAISPAAG
jgi:hypothetical protein